MTDWMTNRRAMLKAIGGGAMLLHPMFRSFHALAQSGAKPKRCIFLFSPNGSVLGAYLGKPGLKVLEYDSSAQNALNAHAANMIVFNGMANRSGGPGDAHAKGIGTLLSGKPFVSDSNTAYSNTITIDQFLAEKIKGQTPFHSLALGAALKPIGDFPNRRVMSVRAASQPNFPNENPQQVFDLLFGGFTPPAGGGGNTAQLEKIREQKRSVLDFASGQLSALSGKLGGEEKKKVEEHLEATRDIERRLQEPLAGGGGGTTGCAAPARPNGNNAWTAAQLEAPANYAAVTKAHMDIIVQAMACDLTRVASLAWNGGSGLMNFGFLGGTTGSTSHHGFSHASGTDPFGNITKIHRWYASQVAYLVAALKSKPEGGGTMLDNTIIFWGSDISSEPIREMATKVQNSHSPDNMRFVMLGNLANPDKPDQPYFNMGRQLTGGSHGGVLAEIANAFGEEGHPYGAPDARLKKV